ncbi:ATP-binding protein [Hyalangium sp.]|uniref:ATP-binding protein n=1 Tax=Hyalangium sp. TaxID=2028555 RepID=UPI002D737201|nr:ATP-binding protein [Hyalangium sp.]HYH99501.1 ATP-binding protein [Hyalangium sp.]
MSVKRIHDHRNLVRELRENKVDALEIVREALSNAKDHGARRVWIRTWRQLTPEKPSILFADDGEGMDDERLGAFWGIGASRKAAASQAIGYKGHGTKLFFASERLTVVTRCQGQSAWRVCTVLRPSELEAEAEIPIYPLDPADPKSRELESMGFLKMESGTAIWVEQVLFGDADMLLRRRRLESYIDWFTVVGDLRSGLFETRLSFHEAVDQNRTEGLGTQEVNLRPLRVDLRVNGDSNYSPLYERDKELLASWGKDLQQYAQRPEMKAFGHRFADVNESSGANKRGARDDLTALRLTTPNDWMLEDGYGIIARVEGNRRQREIYVEARWQNHQGLYGFEERFGLWLCRDYIPIVRKNELLEKALEQASSDGLGYDLGNLRNWQVFVNHQRFLPTANRGDISNFAEHEPKLLNHLVEWLREKLKEESFRDWIDRLRSARHAGLRDREVQQMDHRREDVRAWLDKPKKRDVLDPSDVSGLPTLEPDESIPMKAPRSEQELFYLYGLLSGRHRMPLHILEYNAKIGVDAIASVAPDAQQMIVPKTALARVEFKFEVSAGNSLDHFFKAIDAVVCWRVSKPGRIFEQTAGETTGLLQKRKKFVLTPPLDTYEIEYEEDDKKRIIPVLEVSVLFPALRTKKH